MLGGINGNKGFCDKPKALMCCICGREFGTKSLEIHMKQCEVKNNYRVKIPENYYGLFTKINNGEKLTNNDYEEFNKKANFDFKEKSMFECPNCGRKFLEDRLEVHLKSCKPGSTSKKLEGFSSPQTNKSNLNKNVVNNVDSTKLLEEKLNKQLGISDNKGKGSIGGGLNVGKSNPLSKSSNFNQTDMKPKGPVFLVCYVCCREFGRSSLEIHLEKCMEKHYQEELNKGTPKKEIQTPNPPDILLSILEKVNNKDEVPYSEIQEYNSIAKQMFAEIMQKTCNKCFRKFNADRIDVHLKSCNPEQLSSNKPSLGMASKPRLNTCPLCGREFGSLSLEIHMKTCRIKFDREQEQLPPNQRRNADTIIEKYKQMEISVKGKGEYNMDEMNDKAFKMFNEEALIPCDLCGRTFLPDRLKVHLRSCKGPKVK